MNIYLWNNYSIFSSILRKIVFVTFQIANIYFQVLLNLKAYNHISWNRSV